MDKDKLIAKQQLEIEELKEENNYNKDSLERIHSILYATGGPLNDNILGYSKEQLGPFFMISKLV